MPRRRTNALSIQMNQSTTILNVTNPNETTTRYPPCVFRNWVHSRHHCYGHGWRAVVRCRKSWQWKCLFQACRQEIHAYGQGTHARFQTLVSRRLPCPRRHQDLA
jgi:hypothetical protein